MEKDPRIEKLEKILIESGEKLLPADYQHIESACRRMEEPITQQYSNKMTEMLVRQTAKYLSNLAENYSFYKNNPESRDILISAVEILENN